MRKFCVDLDGTFIKTDMLYESFMYVLKKNPQAVFKALFLLILYGLSFFLPDITNLILRYFHIIKRL